MLKPLGAPFYKGKRMSEIKATLQKAELEQLPIVGAQPHSEKEADHLKEICSYEFYNLEEPGLSITFPYGNTRFMRTFNFFHGAVYQLPRHVARHLEGCATPIWDYRPDGQGISGPPYR